jgi:hypothetical protein
VRHATTFAAYTISDIVVTAGLLLMHEGEVFPPHIHRGVGDNVALAEHEHGRLAAQFEVLGVIDQCKVR